MNYGRYLTEKEKRMFCERIQAICDARPHVEREPMRPLQKITPQLVDQFRRAIGL